MIGQLLTQWRSRVTTLFGSKVESFSKSVTSSVTMISGTIANRIHLLSSRCSQMTQAHHYSDHGNTNLTRRRVSQTASGHCLLFLITCRPPARPTRNIATPESSFHHSAVRWWPIGAHHSAPPQPAAWVVLVYKVKSESHIYRPLFPFPLL
jgi:hypothetical protein